MSFRALAQAHFQLAGGWRQNLLIVSVYAGLVIVFSSIVYRQAGPAERGTVSGVFLSIISVVQGLLLLLVAPGAVRRAVLRDFQTGMIESHRLTPLSGLSLVLGYLTGPTAQAALLYGTGLLLGGYFAASYGQRFSFIGVAVGGWYLSQCCLLTLALLVIALVLLTALATKGKTNLMVVLILVGVFGGWFVVPLVPGLALLTGVMSAGMLMNILGGGGPVGGNSSVMGWAVLLQVAMALTLLAAASRKVRAPDRPVFSIPLGLILLTVTGVTLIVGFQSFDDFAWIFEWDQGPAWQCVGSTVAFVLVGLFPLAAAAEQRYRDDRRAALTGADRPVQVRGVDLLPVVLMLMTAVVMYWMLPWELIYGLEAYADVWAVAGPLVAAVFLSFWTDYALIYWARARGKSAFLAIVFSWLVLKALPLVAEGIAAAVSEIMSGESAVVWWFASLSPIGTMLAVIQDGKPGPGLVVQFVIAVAATLLARRAKASMRTPPAKRRNSPPPAAARL